MSPAPSDAGGPHLERPPDEVPVVDAPPAEPSEQPRDPRWWGSVTLPIGGVARWRAGPSTVFAERRASDWRIWHEAGTDAYATDAERARRVEEEPPDTRPTARFSFAETPDTITVSPVLADRPVIVRPESALSIPPGERVTLYASSPVWMAVQLQVRRPRRGSKGPSPVVLTELPTFRPSDTWFGPSTREGELCYAVRTAARTEVADLPLRPHRAVTPMTIENQAATAMDISRIEAPMPFLALHLDRSGRLWTDAVLLTREVDDDTSVKVTPGAPTGGERLAEPRDARTFGQTISRTFSRLLRGENR
jgi:hypothetical protein